MSAFPISMSELLEAGVHFGHQTRRWHPHMKPFIYGERSGIHIIDLQQTLPRFRDACEFLRETVAHGGKVLFVSTKRQAQDIVAETARSCGMPFVHRRWLGGMLTNFRTIRKGIDRYKELIGLLGGEDEGSSLSKKDVSRLTREHLKLHKAFEGIADMENLPDAMFVIDIRKEALAMQEARRLGIPIIAVVDTNCDPDGIDFSIPGNDDAIRAIYLYCEKAAEACRQGAELHNERIVEESKKVETAAKDAPLVGKRVVEITQPVRRPARMERMADERKEGEKGVAAPAGEAVVEAAAPAQAAETPKAPAESS